MPYPPGGGARVAIPPCLSMGPEAHGRKRRHFGPYPEPSMAAPSEATVRSIPRRSTSESLLIQNGESLSYVKEQLGHSSVKITVDVYARLVPGSDRQAVNRLLPLYGFRAAGQNRMHWSVLDGLSLIQLLACGG
jgi:hypothetical protein